ncbi:tetratricopeptide repeat protein [Dapis sp. BLCC M229]|uniref:tetratricopeptide repeat protein n=1 Tax=Dapis sp. BLCC M229 TaxID=3400188 RepID=UPI003CEE0236
MKLSGIFETDFLVDLRRYLSMGYWIKCLGIITTALVLSFPTIEGFSQGGKLGNYPALAQNVSYNRANSQSEIDRLLKEGAAYYQDWKFEKALEKFQQVLKMRRGGDLEAEARALFYVGVTYQKLGEGEKVLDSYWEVMGIAEEASSQKEYEKITQYLCRSSGGQTFLTEQEKINPIKYCEGIKTIEEDSGSVTLLFDEDDNKE